MLLDMIKKITGQNRQEEVPMEVLQVLCDLETLEFNPSVDTQTVEEVLNSQIQEDGNTSYILYNNCKIHLTTFPLYQGNIYLGEYVDKFSLSNIDPVSGENISEEPQKELPEAFLDRIAFLKAARLLALEDQCKIIRADSGFPHTELDISYLTNF